MEKKISSNTVKLYRCNSDPDYKNYQIFTKLERKEYNSSDIVFLCTNDTISKIFEYKLSKIILKKNKEDKGRNVCIEICSNPNILFQKVKNRESFGLILIDENLGPDYQKFHCFVRKIRKLNYTGYILLLLNHEKYTYSVYKDYGIDGIIFKYKKQIFPFITSVLKKILTRTHPYNIRNNELNLIEV